MTRGGTFAFAFLVCLWKRIDKCTQFAVVIALRRIGLRCSTPGDDPAENQSDANYNQRNTQSDMVVRRRHFGGCSSPLNQPLVLSVFMGSGPSQLRHRNVRLVLPPWGSAQVRYAPQWGQIGLSDCPMT
jgi:hypothetical protein